MNDSGIYVSRQPQGTKISVKTKNSIYELQVLDSDGSVRICGGIFEIPEIVHFNGCTFGGTMLKIDWIGKGMYMEFVTGDRRYTTSMVREATLYGRDWAYTMEWGS